MHVANPATVGPPYLIGVACGFCRVTAPSTSASGLPILRKHSLSRPSIGNQLSSRDRHSMRRSVTLIARSAARRPQVAGRTGAQPRGDLGNVARWRPRPHQLVRASSAILPTSTIVKKHAAVTADGVRRDVCHILKDGAGLNWSRALSEALPGGRAWVATACAALRGVHPPRRLRRVRAGSGRPLAGPVCGRRGAAVSLSIPNRHGRENKQWVRRATQPKATLWRGWSRS